MTGWFVYAHVTMNISDRLNYNNIISMMSSADRNFSAPDTTLGDHHHIFSSLLAKMSLWGT